MSPACPSESAVGVSCWYSGCRPSPLTSTFSDSGNFTSYFVLQKVLISSGVPGSCSPNWLQGIPTTEKPCAPKRSYSFSNPSYCGVSPQNDATFTSSVTLPFWSPRMPGSPLSELSEVSYTDMEWPPSWSSGPPCQSSRCSSKPTQSRCSHASVARTVPPRPMCSGCHFDPIPAVDVADTHEYTAKSRYCSQPSSPSRPTRSQ